MADNELVREYVQVFKEWGLGNRQARKMAKLFYQEATRMSVEQGTNLLPLNMGDLILDDAVETETRIAEIVERIKTLHIPKVRREGARDDDIRMWWNMPDVERQMAVVSDDHVRMQTFVMALEETIEPDKEKALDIAAAMVRKAHPMYGDPDDTSQTQGDDRPLPYELKDRVNVYVLRRATMDQEQFKADIESSSSFNALVRKEMRAGKL